MRIRSKLSVAVVCALSVLGFLAAAPAAARLAAPQSAGRLIQDRNGITYIQAGSLHDLFYLQGWVHARDRLFQMDVSRREPSGTLAELLGKAALPGDVQARTIGLRRAAERSWAAAPPDLRAMLTAYSDGVNAYVAGHPLPPEYAALHRTSFRPWTAVDTLTIGKAIAFELSFGLDIAPTLQLDAYVAALGPQRGYALFSQDVMRSQPFSDASTVPDAGGGEPAAGLPPRLTPAALGLLSAAAPLARRYLTGIAGDPLFAQALSRDGSASTASAQSTLR